MITSKSIGFIRENSNDTDQDPDENVEEEEVIVEPAVYKRQYIILKADDMTFDPVNIIPPRWKKYIEYVETKRMKATIGIIGSSLEKGNQQYYDQIKEIDRNGSIEFWNHGYNHVLNAINKNGTKWSEFQNTTVEYQLNELKKTQDIVKEKTGITLKAFGAPGNAFDDNTGVALDMIPEIKMWIFGNRSSKKFAFIYKSMENSKLQPDFEQFLKGYDKDAEIIVYQMHPKAWNDESFAVFVKCIDYLESNNVRFITMSDYQHILSKKDIRKPPLP